MRSSVSNILPWLVLSQLPRLGRVVHSIYVGFQLTYSPVAGARYQSPYSVVEET